MENTILFRLEIIIFFLSLGYFLYYSVEKISQIYCNVRKTIKPSRKISEEKIEKIKKIVEEKKIIKKTKTKSKKVEKKSKKLSKNDSERIIEILKKVRLNTDKQYFDKAKNLLIE